MADNFDNIGDSIINDLLKKITPDIQNDANYKMALAAKIFAAMKKKQWNKTEFALQMKVKNSVITRWLSGYHNFETDTLIKIENILNIELLNLSQDNASDGLVALTNKSIDAKSTAQQPLLDYIGGSQLTNTWEGTEVSYKESCN